MLRREDQVTLVAGGIKPGTVVSASFTYAPDDGTPGVNTGLEGNFKVNAAGSVTLRESYDTLTNGSFKAGTFHAWLRLFGSPFNASPVETNDGPAEITWHFEGGNPEG